MRIPNVGQTLYSLNINNSARFRPQTLIPVVVTSVGRKYFKVKLDWGEKEYRMDTWMEKTEYSSDSKLYQSPQEWEEEKEKEVILKAIRDYFGLCGGTRLSLAQLKSIKTTIDSTP